MQSARFSLTDLQQSQTESWSEFLTHGAISVGLYRVAAGVGDQATHEPHDRDEVYLCLKGRGLLTAGGETYDVQPQHVIFVAKGVEHHYHDVAEELELLVFFG